MVRQAVILAGGKGTRLAARLHGRPKPLVDVLGVPLLQRQIEALRAAGFDSLVILVNHQADQIRDFCTQHRDWGMDLRLIDDGEPRGTAGAVFDTLDSLAEQFVVVYGDTLFDVDFARFLAFHAASNDTVGTLFLHPNDHPHDSDLVEVDRDQRIRKFHSYPHPDGVWLPNMVNAALYVLDRAALAEARAAFAGNRGVIDLAKHVFPWMLTAGAVLGGYVSSEYIKDIGTPDRLDRACAALGAGKVAQASLRVPQTAVFLDRDGTLNRANGHISAPAQLDMFDFAGQAVKLLNNANLRAVLITNQPVIARGETDFEGLAQIHAKLETLLGRDGALLDRIYLCPHHTDRGFAGEVPELKFDCDCRKPKPGMLLAAARDMNIDLAASWMIGDSTADVRAGAAAGVTTIRVATGEAARAGDPPAAFEFATVLEAVQFITGTFTAFADFLDARLAAADVDAPVIVAALDADRRALVATMVATRVRQRGEKRQIVTALASADGGTAHDTGTAALTIDVDGDAAMRQLNFR